MNRYYAAESPAEETNNVTSKDINIQSAKVGKRKKIKKAPRKQKQKNISSNQMDTNLKEAVAMLIETDGELFICKACGKTAGRKRYMREHVEIHIEGLFFQCNQCNLSFRSRNCHNLSPY